jgi:hypothetical protein
MADWLRCAWGASGSHGVTSVSTVASGLVATGIPPTSKVTSVSGFRVAMPKLTASIRPSGSAGPHGAAGGAPSCRVRARCRVPFAAGGIWMDPSGGSSTAVASFGVRVDWFEK